MSLLYSHYSGAGNAFFIFDNRKENFPLACISEICRQHGLDGVIFLESSKNADYKMRIFNRDSSEAEMCGNGLRCFIKYLKELGFCQKTYVIETKAGIHTAWLQEEGVCVHMRPPSQLKWNLAPNLSFINTGVPHAVLFVPSVDSLDISVEGPKWRFHPFFAPAGANVNFVSLRDENSIFIRTYERGVEGETLACGTGAVASALATAYRHSYSSPLEVFVRSGEILKISFTKDFKNIEMEGPATLIKRGSFSLNDNFSIMHTS